MNTNIISPYAEALLSIFWTTEQLASPNKVYRRLIFASIEMIPEYWKSEGEVPEQRIKVSKTKRLYFIRVKRPSLEAFRIYEDIIRTNRLKMFWQADGSFIDLSSPEDVNAPFVNLPQLPLFSTTHDLPIASTHWGVVRANHFMPCNRPLDLERWLNDEAIIKWLNDRLMWRLDEHIEYLSSVNLILPNPYYFRSRCQLEKIAGGSGESVTVSLGKMNEAAEGKLHLYFCEKINDEFANFSIFEIDTSINIPLSGKADEVGYFIVADGIGLIDYSEFCSFIRSISFTMDMTESKHVVSVHGGDTYEVAKRTSMEHMISDEKDKDCPELKLANKIVEIRRTRKKKEVAEKLQQRIFYRSEDEARNFVRDILNSARHDIMIIDPYFSNAEICNYLPAVPSVKINIQILTSSECLRLFHKNKEESGAKEKCEGEYVAEKIHELSEKNLIPGVNVEVMSHSMDFHDRFIVIDNKQVWLSGNSFNRLGDRASIMLQLPNPDEVIAKIAEIKAKGCITPLAQWLKNHKSSKEDEETIN